MKTYSCLLMKDSMIVKLLRGYQELNLIMNFKYKIHTFWIKQ